MITRLSSSRSFSHLKSSLHTIQRINKISILTLPRKFPVMAASGSSGAEVIAAHEDGDFRSRSEGRGGGGNRGRGRGRGERGGGGEMNREVAISKGLSKLLRHAAEEAGLKLDEQGFARVDEVVCIVSLQSLAIASQKDEKGFLISNSHVCPT
jgi:hypothetical protein